MLLEKFKDAIIRQNGRKLQIKDLNPWERLKLVHNIKNRTIKSILFLEITLDDLSKFREENLQAYQRFIKSGDSKKGIQLLCRFIYRHLKGNKIKKQAFIVNILRQYPVIKSATYNK